MNAAHPPWIFVHVQKTGGNAVRSALGMAVNDVHKHFFARELRDIHGRAAWESPLQIQLRPQSMGSPGVVVVDDRQRQRFY